MPQITLVLDIDDEDELPEGGLDAIVAQVEEIPGVLSVDEVHRERMTSD